jgi:hypothetical protein
MFVHRRDRFPVRADEVAKHIGSVELPAIVGNTGTYPSNYLGHVDREAGPPMSSAFGVLEPDRETMGTHTKVRGRGRRRQAASGATRERDVGESFRSSLAPMSSHHDGGTDGGML